MKHSLLSLLFVFIFSTISFCQDLAMVRDTVNGFEVGVPVGWRYGVPANQSVNFIALRQKETEADVPRENYNINVLGRNEQDLDKTYKEFLASVGEAEDFEVVEQGDTTINERRYKYLIEKHKNKHSGENMHNYVLVANKEGKVLILTMVTTSENFPKFQPLFDKVASSLRY
ncbi:PsbP-related protein [Pontibacter sp. H249]|uniref:PsbP-related protein n=1 Tax=Pontibacter sp. H249 TaxID=3133420 RepID=UPI0030BB061F